MVELEQAVRAGIETIGLIHSLAEIEEKYRKDGQQDARLAGALGQTQSEVLRVCVAFDKQILEMLHDLEVYRVDIESPIYDVIGDHAWYNWRTRVRFELLRNEFESMFKGLVVVSSGVTALLLCSHELKGTAEAFQESVDLKWMLCNMMNDSSVRAVLEKMQLMANNNLKRLMLASAFPDMLYKPT